MATLILFDIDGTLVLTGGAGVRAMTHALREVFGIAGGLGEVPVAGRTDAWILAQVAALHGVPCDGDRVRRFHDCYVTHLAREVAEPGPRKGVLPGVRPLLDVLSTRDDVYLGLLTGNYYQGARIKLQHFDLWRYFGAGAFGDEAHDRNGLLWTAIDRVASDGGPAVDPTDVVVVGDTPLDVGVAVAGGARSLAVATGNYTADALRVSGADTVVDTLSNLEEVLEALRLRPSDPDR